MPTQKGRPANKLPASWQLCEPEDDEAAAFPVYASASEKLSPEEKSAIRCLEKAGWAILMKAKIGECIEKAGSRKPTWKKEGRYDFALVKK
jgi:hypothetical protein